MFYIQLRGLCGKYNSKDSDDMTTRMDLPEMNAEHFAASYCQPLDQRPTCNADLPIDCPHFGVQYVRL